MPTPDDMIELLGVSGLTLLNALELVLGLVILGIVVLQLIGAEKSTSRLFMQADVNMLFPSPRSPQGILAFRVATTLSLAVVAVIPQLFWLPQLQQQWGIGFYAALTIPLAWCMTLGFSALLKMLAFELGSRHRFIRQNLRWVLLGALALVGIVFYRVYDAAPEPNLLTSAHQMFNAPWTRAVPVWGWIKGMVVCAWEGRTDVSVGLLSLNVLFMALLGFVVAKTKADYYEETLGWAEDVARFREELASDNAALVILEVSQRGNKRRGEGFEVGWGASVYFHKVLHQRRRFARYGFVTKTMMTYLFAAIAAGLFVRFFMEDDRLPYIPALLLVAMVFFRTVISPVTEDVRKDSFLLLPEPIWTKLFFSLAGGSVNCALDVAVPLIAGSVAAGFSPLEGLLYLPVLVLADFFASSSGVFADVSIPPSIGVSLKQVAKVLLLYCGLIFDGMVLTYGLGAGDIVLGFVLASFINLLFGAVFLGLAGVWLHPRHGLPAKQGAVPVDLTGARSTYTRVGLALAAMFVVVYGGRHLMAGWVPPLVSMYLSLYVLGPVAYLVVAGRSGSVRPERNAEKLKIHQVLALVPVCLFVAYFGNIVGFSLQWFLNTLPSLNLLSEPAVPTTDGLALQMGLAAVVSPVMEEFVFRRCLIDRLSPFGERAALVVAAVAFGLFHGTANQLCYGTLLGLVFGYVYLRTSRLRYTIGVHMAINILSSVVLSALLFSASNAVFNNDSNALVGWDNLMLSQVIGGPAVVALIIYVTLLVVLALFGVVLFAYGLSERRIMPGGIKVAQAFSAWGVVVFLVLSVAALL